MFQSFIHWQLAISLGLTGYFLFNPITLAQYQPHPDQKKAPQSTRTGSGTTRGCEKDTISPTILASHQYVGQTTSLQPSFAWFISDTQPRKMEVIVYEYRDYKYQKIQSISLQSSQGLMTLSPFSEENSPLKVGTTYLWQVVLLCDPNSPSSALVDYAYFEVVEIPSSLPEKLDNINTSQEKVRLLAEAGLWYDALYEALKLSNNNQLGKVGIQLLNELADSEKPDDFQRLNPSEQMKIERRIDRLREVANRVN